MIKTNSGSHVKQSPHEKGNCKINKKKHSHPDMDCGHPVDAGPGVGLTDYNGAGNDDTKTAGEAGEPGERLEGNN